MRKSRQGEIHFFGDDDEWNGIIGNNNGGEALQEHGEEENRQDTPANPNWGQQNHDNLVEAATDGAGRCFWFRYGPGAPRNSATPQNASRILTMNNERHMGFRK